MRISELIHLLSGVQCESGDLPIMMEFKKQPESLFQKVEEDTEFLEIEGAEIEQLGNKKVVTLNL